MTEVKKVEDRLPLHFSQAFNITQVEDELDFFDANLEYDSPLFIDPFLIAKSTVKQERDLFVRFGDFFRYIFDQSIKIDIQTEQYKNLLDLLDFKEPKELCLGYTEFSNDGNSPGKSFGNMLIKFFLNASARKLVQEDNLYPDKKFNPITLEMFTRNLGEDGLSDISANLIMDYLITYTQKQCKSLGIKMKELPVNADGFDFTVDKWEWKGGGHYLLPENPLKHGRAVILVPKRLLRSPYIDDSRMVKKVVGILNNDPALSRKFAKLLQKEVADFNIDDIRQVMVTEHSIFKEYIKYLYNEKREPYDFSEDYLAFCAYKKYSNIFDDKIPKASVEGHKDLFDLTSTFIELISKHFSTTSIWRDMWKENPKGTLVPNSEGSLQRIVFAIGKGYFKHFPDVSFLPEVESGNGPVDFIVIFKNVKIAIEFKRLLSSSYFSGVKNQLPIYIKNTEAMYGVYVTVQHYTSTRLRGDNTSDDKRVKKIEEALKGIDKEIKNSHKIFEKLLYINIDVSPKLSASKDKR